jgi:hypothetical protein
VVELSESGAAVARARDEILGVLTRSASTTFQPQELIRQIAGNNDRDAYRAALMSLLASGVIERADGWTVRLSSDHAPARS